MTVFQKFLRTYLMKQANHPIVRLLCAKPAPAAATKDRIPAGKTAAHQWSTTGSRTFAA